jgi:hypothetical protein
MGVRFELHELLFEVAANVVVVPDDGVNEEEASSGESENAKSIGCRSEGGVAAAVQVAGTRRDETSGEFADIWWQLPDRATRLDRSVEKKGKGLGNGGRRTRKRTGCKPAPRSSLQETIGIVAEWEEGRRATTPP